MKTRIIRGFCLLIVCFVFFTSTITKDIYAANNDPSLSLDTRSLAMINKPGVVLLQTIWTADLTLNEFALTSDFDEDLSNAIIELISDGTIPDTEEAIYSTMVQLMIENMKYYTYNTGNVYSEKVSTAAVGTGFIITSDGYMLTNAHVVNTDENELYMNFAISSLDNYAIEGTNMFASEMKSSGYEMSQDELEGYMNAYYELLAENININNLQTSYQCFLGNVTPGSDVSAKGQLLDLRKMGAPIPGKDVAVMKLDKINLPTVVLGDDFKMRTGDQVYAMGYPAVATINDALNVAQAIQEPTMTSGIISARKQMTGGWDILQTDADIHGGNSGGPLFNAKGEVIGINTFGMIDPNSGSQVSGMNFAVPISVAIQFLNEINIKPNESDFTTQYKKAVSYFQNEKYHEALELLRGLNETNPGYPVVADLLAECRILADKNPQKSQPPKTSSAFIDNNLIIFIAAGSGLLLIIILIIIIASRGKRKRAVNQIIQNNYTDHQYRQVQANQNTIICPNCNHTLKPESMFCNECGTKIDPHY